MKQIYFIETCEIILAVGLIDILILMNTSDKMWTELGGDKRTWFQLPRV